MKTPILKSLDEFLYKITEKNYIPFVSSYYNLRRYEESVKKYDRLIESIKNSNTYTGKLLRGAFKFS